MAGIFQEKLRLFGNYPTPPHPRPSPGTLTLFSLQNEHQSNHGNKISFSAANKRMKRTVMKYSL